MANEVEPLVLLAPLAGGGQVIRWQTVPGKNYELYATPTVTQAMEPISSSITAYSATTSYTNVVGGGAQHFYRVRVFP